LPAGSDGSQLSNPSGISFPLNTGVLAIAEIQYAINGGVGAEKPDPHGPLPGWYKLGAWYDSESFDNLRYDNLGLPLASDFSDGAPASHHGDYSIYALADQTVWRAPDGGRSVTVASFRDRAA
jgi:porin